jgi:RimJ/RimL family protein N-acetyltransferase
MNFTVRCAEDNDYINLKMLYGDFICDMSQYDPTDFNMDKEMNEWIINAINKIKSIIYVVIFENDIIGFIRLQIKERTDNSNNIIEYIKLSDLYVMPEFRNTGVASSLVHQAMIWGKEKNAFEIVLNVYEANKRAIDFYLNFGFIYHENISLKRIRMIAKIV